MTDLRGHPLNHVAVTITRSDGFYQPYFLNIGADGTFSLIRLENAPYTVCFTADQTYPQPVSCGYSDTGYLNECFDNGTPDAPTPVQVGPSLSAAPTPAWPTGGDRRHPDRPGRQPGAQRAGGGVQARLRSRRRWRLQRCRRPLPGHLAAAGPGYVVCAYPSWQNPSPNAWATPASAT